MNLFLFLILAIIVLSPAVVVGQDSADVVGRGTARAMKLPAPQMDGRYSVEKALAARRSVREFRDTSLNLATLAQLAWAAQGVTQTMDAPPGWSWGNWQGGKRTAPSAGALYPLELYVIARKIDGLTPGVYKYKPLTHELLPVGEGGKRSELTIATNGQKWIEEAPCVFIVGAVYQRTAVKYGERAQRYVHIEVGHAVENICLQAVALDLGSTMVGAFKDDEVKKVVGMADDEEPLALVPVGKGE